MEGKSFKFSRNLYDILHDDSKDSIRTHNYCYFAFFNQKCGFWRKTKLIGTENNLWKIELDQIIFLDFKGIWCLKYK